MLVVACSYWLILIICLEEFCDACKYSVRKESLEDVQSYQVPQLLKWKYSSACQLSPLDHASNKSNRLVLTVELQ